MNTIKTIKTQDKEGQISDNIFIEVDAVNVDLTNGQNLQEKIDSIENNFNSLSTNITEVEEDINEINNNIDNISQEIQDMGIEINNLDNIISELNYDTEIQDLYNKVNGSEKLNNKTISIDENSTNIEYPSAKAVYDLFISLRNLIENRE